MQSHFRTVPLSNVLKFEGIANRDSLPYAKTYELGPVGTLDTVLRGTLRQVLKCIKTNEVADIIFRYPGFCSLMYFFQRIGLLETEHPILLSNWTSFVPRALASKFAVRLSDNDAASIHSALSDIIDIPKQVLPQLIYTLAWLGISPVQHNSSISAQCNILPIPPPPKPLAPIDLLAIVLSHQLRYQPSERDMVVLMHEISTGPTFAHGRNVGRETYTSTLIVYGTPTSTAMSRTVGLPVALATLAILDGQVHARGVHGPTMEGVYGPVLRGLEENGLVMKESVTFHGGSGQVLRDGLQSTLGRKKLLGTI